MKIAQSWLSCAVLMSSPALAAANADAVPDRAALERSVASALHVLSTAPNTDEALLQLETLMPHLGGLYLGEDGAAHVLLTEDAPRGERLTAQSIGEAVAQMRSHSVTGQRQQRLAPAQVESARFRFSELARIRDYATDVLNLEDVQSLDANERANRVSVGVLSEKAEAHVREYWARLGLPAESLDVTRQRRLEAMATLSTQTRPMPGGYSIRNGNFSYTTCTAGYTAYSASVGRFGFITNSHCTNTSGGVEGTLFYQGGPFAFATEYLDPIFQTSSSVPGCPSGQLCRRSDSAFAGDANSSNFELGAVAQPVGYCSLPQTHCTTTVNTSSLIYPRTFASAPMVGQYFEKVGQTTGWTYGQLDNSCTTVRDASSGRYFVCQYTVYAGVDAGDSGSPVFTWNGTNNPIGGMLWGGDPATHDYFVFSHYSDIAADLGTLYYY